MWCGHTREPCCIRFLRLLYQISTNFATSNNTNVLLFHSSVSQKFSAGFARLNPRCLQAVSPSGSSQGEAISCSFSCWKNSVSGAVKWRFLFLLAVNWGPFPVSRDPCILWFVAPSSIFKSQPQQVLLTLQSSCLPSSLRLPVKDEWLDWTHPGNPKRSFYLRVFTLNHICRVSLSCKGIYSQVPGVEVWTSGRREVREYIILSTTTRKQFLKMRWTSRYW